MGWWKQKLTVRDWIVNAGLYLIGIALMPLGVVLTVNSHLGAGGYDALNFALGDQMGIPTSYAIYLTAFIAVILAAVIRRKMLRLTTFISSFFLGIFTDIWKVILSGVEGINWWTCIVIFALGMVIIAFSVAAYILCVFPSNPTDDLVAALKEKGIRIGLAKIGLDLFCMILAFVLGGEIGLGTVVCTLCLGPVVDMFYGKLKSIVDKYQICVGE